MKHYERLNLLETEVMHMRENLAIFKSVMEAHMNDFAKSQTDEGLALWRTLQLMETNTEQTYKLFYELFDDIKKDSREQEAKQTNLYPGWNVTFPEEPINLESIMIDPTGIDSVATEYIHLTDIPIDDNMNTWNHIVNDIKKSSQ